MVERISSGIPGLDELIEGGIPKSSVTLISGGTGTGKTTFCSQFLMEGLEKGEKTLYISTEEPPEAILDDSEEYNWNFREYQEKGQYEIDYIDPSKNEFLSGAIKEKINNVSPERIVIDSISVFGIYWEDQYETRRNLQDLVAMLRRADSTIIMTAEIPEDEEDALSRSKVSEFVADGVIALYYQAVGEGSFRNIEVRKMRRTDHTPGTHPLEITDEGMRIKQDTGF
jgi:KaiC/GvpD/RAD55 family RecA-like ATPase